MVGMPPGYDSALIWMGRGEPARAVPILEGLAAREPENIHVKVALADAHLALGERAKAVAELKEALRVSPGYSVAQGLLEIAGEEGAPR